MSATATKSSGQASAPETPPADSVASPAPVPQSRRKMTKAEKRKREKEKRALRLAKEQGWSPPESRDAAERGETGSREPAPPAITDDAPSDGELSEAEQRAHRDRTAKALSGSALALAGAAHAVWLDVNDPHFPQALADEFGDIWADTVAPLIDPRQGGKLGLLFGAGATANIVFQYAAMVRASRAERGYVPPPKDGA